MRKKQFMPYEAPDCSPLIWWEQAFLCTSPYEGDNEQFDEENFDL